MAGDYVYKYYVVRFLEKPYETVDLEVCVPYGWMKIDKRGQNPSVAYPAEYSPFIKLIVQNNCWIQKGWRYYKVKVQFATDSFTAAEKYIKASNNNKPQKTKCSNTEVNESKSATKRKTLSLNQSSSLGPAAQKCRTQDPHLRNSRTEHKGRLCNEKLVQPISMKELLKKQAKPNEIYKSTTDVEMSTVTNNTVEEAVLERSATKESSLIQASQSCRPLTDTNEENLPTVDNNDIIYKFNVIDDKPECLNKSKAKANKRKPKRKRNKPLKSKNIRYLPFFNYTHPSIIKQIQLAYATLGCDQKISFERFVSNYLTDKSHKHQTPAWYTTSHFNSQSQQDPRSAKDKILEENVTVASYSKAPNPSSLVPNIPHNNQSSMVNKPILCHSQHQENMSVAKSIHEYDNVQQSCPKITIVKTPSALYRLQNKIAHHSQLSSHTHGNQLLTINKTRPYQEPKAQEILDRSIGVNRDQSAYSQSAAHQELYIQKTLHRPTVEIPIEQSHISQSTTKNGNVTIPVDVKIPINRTPSCTEENRQFSEKILNKSPKILFSPDHENHTLEKGSLQNLNTKISIRIGDVDKNSQHQKNPQNTLSAVKNTSNSSKNSTSPLNGSSGKQSSVVTQDLSIIEPHDQEKRTGKQSNLNHTEKVIHSENNKENESCPVLSDLDTKESFKKQLLLAYQYLIQEQSSSTTEDSLDLKMPKEEITVEKTSTGHNESTICAQNETEYHHQSEMNNIFNNNHTPTRVKESRLDTIDLIEQLKMNNVDVSISASAQKPEDSPTNNENKKSNNVEPNYIADDDHDGKNDDDNDNNNGYYIVENDSHDELQKQKHGSKRTFVLPPEYNPNDSRWTLKYPRIVPGVVELIAGSNTYVNETNLDNCIRVANNYRTLGRMLLVEIFSQNALSVCSLSGRKPNALNIRKFVRPGLDGEAVTNLLKYLEIYGIRKRWYHLDQSSVVTSLRNKINEIRSKNRA